MSKKLIRLMTIGLALMILMSAIFGLTAANTVPESGMGFETYPISANQAKPDACNGLNLDSIIVGGSGTASNNLLLGTAGVDSLTGGEGNDCLVAGAGDDSLDGGEGTDICLGGDGTDTFLNCETEID